MRKRIVSIMLVFLLAAAAGCAKKGTASPGLTEAELTTILIRDDGSVDVVFVEPFDKDYYSKDEAETYIRQVIDEYNAKAGDGAAALKSVELVQTGVKGTFHYKSVQDLMGYGGFNMQVGGLASMEKAVSAGYVPERLTKAKDGSEVTGEAVEKESKCKVLTLDVKEKINVMVEGAVRYFDGGALIDSNTVQLSGDAAGTVIYK